MSTAMLHMLPETDLQTLHSMALEMFILFTPRGFASQNISLQQLPLFFEILLASFLLEKWTMPLGNVKYASFSDS